MDYDTWQCCICGKSINRHCKEEFWHWQDRINRHVHKHIEQGTPPPLRGILNTYHLWRELIGSEGNG